MSFLLTFCAAWPSLAAQVSVRIDGEEYSCSKGGSGASCDCRVKGNYVEFAINGQAIQNWWNSGGQTIVTCANYLKKQAGCEAARISCGCEVSGNYVQFTVNGASVQNWWNSGGQTMLTCVEYQNKQDYCK